MSWSLLEHDLLECEVCGQPARYRYQTEDRAVYAQAIKFVIYRRILRCRDHAPAASRQRKK